VDLELPSVGLDQPLEGGLVSGASPRQLPCFCRFANHVPIVSKAGAPGLTLMQMRNRSEIHRAPMSFDAGLHLSNRRQRNGGDMADYTIKRTDDMETIFDGIVHRARASLGATSLGMQVMHFPAGWEGYPNHDHAGDSADENDLGQEEIYIALDGWATLLVDGDEHALEPGVIARVGPAQKRRILPGPDGFRMVAVGGRPGEAYRPPAWTELGGPLPTPP
jgi:hypothetical protein